VRSVACGLLCAFASVNARAQNFEFRPPVQWELRADGLFASGRSGQIGVGANVPAGYAIRVGLTAAAGPAWEARGARPSARIDLASRYLLDPFKEIPWGVYAGAGVSMRWDDQSEWRGYVLIVVGAEGPEKGGWRTAVEAGLGGGARVGIVLRRARRNGR
jgi:hypothetical protein